MADVMQSVPVNPPTPDPVPAPDPDPTPIKFHWPCSRRPATISHPYGEERPGFTHEGIDIVAVTGDEITAGMDGVVYSVSGAGAYGLHVWIQSGTWRHAYAHMSKVADGIKPGVSIKAGQVIGYAGSTGNSTGAHLHVTLQDTTSNARLRGIALLGCVNPAPYLVYPLLVGLHDAGGMEWMKQHGKKGVALIHTALGTEPTMIDVTQYAAAGITVIGRLNYGHAEGTGTLPPPGDLEAFQNAAIQTMKQSRGVAYWQYCNEINNASEWPEGFSITPDYYIRSYNNVWAHVGKDILMGPSPIDPYLGPGSNNRDWWTEILGRIAGADVLFLHSKTQTNDPGEVFSDAKFGSDPLKWQYLHFRTIETSLEVVPTRFKKLPVYVTEVNPQRVSDTKLGWIRRNLDWIRNSKQYVVMLNNITAQPISGLVYYRWADDEWALCDQPDMLEAIFT